MKMRNAPPVVWRRVRTDVGPLIRGDAISGACARGWPNASLLNRREAGTEVANGKDRVPFVMISIAKINARVRRPHP
jgi:hypothetical protein